MAAETKKGGVKHHHVKSISAPATPQRPGSGTPEEHRIAAEHEKPIPSYLRPTISSCRNTKAPSSSSQLKERTAKPSSHLPKATKTPVLWSKSQSFSRATSIRTKQHVALVESSSFSGVTAKKKYANRLPTLEPEVVRPGVNSNEEKMTGATRVVRQAGGHEGKRVALKRRESSQPHNEVMEETVAERRRRNKVSALVGAFETVISLQEPEGRPSPKVHSQEKEKAGEEEEVDKLDCNDRQEGKETNVNVGGIVNQDMEENNVEDDRIQIQIQIRIRTDEKKKVQGDEDDEEEKKVEIEPESTKTTIGVEECYRLGHESQQQREEMESTESTTEEEEDKGSELTGQTNEHEHEQEQEKKAEESKLEV